MKNKKGFTLVELLAVIAILAILVIIALPNVLKMFRSAKENTFVTEVQEIVKTAEQNYLSDSLSNKECKCFSSASNPLNLNGRDNIEYYVEFNDNGQVINLTVKDNNYQFVSEGEVINIADIGSSTSGKAKKTTIALESTEVPSCDGSSEEESKFNIQYDSMLRVIPDYTECEYMDGTPAYLCAEFGTSGRIETLKITNTNNIPEEVLGSEDVSNDNSENIMMWWTDTDNDDLYEVTIGGEGGVRANTDSSWLFSKMSNLESIDLRYLDTSQVVNMAAMFYDSLNLTNLDLSNFDTSNVTDMGSMLSGCSNLTSITYGNKFVINDDTDIWHMFSSTDNLTNEPYIKFNSIYAERLNGN